MQNATPRRTRFVGVRFTPEEYAKIEAMAETAQVELSAYVRSVLVDTAVPPRARGKSADKEMLGKALVALNRIGNNLNQIARQANVSGNAIAYQQAQSDRAMLVAAAKAVVAAMEG